MVITVEDVLNICLYIPNLLSPWLYVLYCTTHTYYTNPPVVVTAKLGYSGTRLQLHCTVVRIHYDDALCTFHQTFQFITRI
jgi:hypothetical protein